jgi:zinc protease
MTMKLPPAAPRPRPAPPRPYHFPRFTRHQLANGMRVVVAPVRKLPVVSVLALVDAGAMTDAAGAEGLAVLTAGALTEGTRRRDGARLALDAESLGASLDASADWDSAVVRLSVLTPRLEQAFALFTEVLTEPAFPEREIERLKEERLAELLQQRTEPRTLADEAFAAWVYAKGSRYARPEAGSEPSVRAITRERLERFWASRYRPGATTLVIVGDVEADAALALVERALGSWSGDAAPAARVDDRPARAERGVLVVAKADAPQSELRVGHVGLPRNNPDFFPATVMNAILGGLFSSRINLNLREAHAWTYGAHSGFDWRLQAGPWVADSAVKSEVTADAVQEIMNEIDRIRTTPVAPEELSLATSYLDGVFPIRYESTGAIAGALANLVLYGLPDDYFDRYRANVRAVTAADVLAAARARLWPDRAVVVIAGDAEKIRPELEALDAGPVVVADPAEFEA